MLQPACSQEACGEIREHATCPAWRAAGGVILWLGDGQTVSKSNPTWHCDLPPIVAAFPGGHQGPRCCSSSPQRPASPCCLSARSPGPPTPPVLSRSVGTLAAHTAFRLSLSPGELDSRCHTLQKLSWTTWLARRPPLGSHSPLTCLCHTSHHSIS